jgi:hypothetical protein
MTAAKGTSKSVVVKFVLDQPKKHSVLYREVAEGGEPVLRSLYVANEAIVALGNPKALLVTIAAV